MRVLPILFNTDMVRALLAGRKTATRRPIKVRFRDGEAEYIIVTRVTGEFCYLEICDEWETPTRRLGAPYRTGDILYVRETWAKIFALGKPYYIFKADDLDSDMGRQKSIWRPSIHMPKEAARIFLRVKAVWVERLQDITEEQARAEGFGSRSEFLEAFLAMYPDCTEESWLWVIEFERVDKPEGWPI